MISGAVLHNFYVDDCLVSVSTVKEAVTMQQKLTELLARRGFYLTKWISNNDKVLESISDLERSNLGQFMLDNGVKEKVLGMQWHIKGDYFTFDIHVNKKPFIRRGLLSMIASVYDPMGFVAPVILEAKLLLQDLCKQKANWDSVISEEERVRWSRAIRYISMQPYRTRLNKLYAFSKLLKVNELYQYSAMKFMFRLYNDREFKNKIPLVNEIHAYNTRQSSNNNIFISHFLACKSSNSLIVNCIKMWNKLPINIRTEQRIKSFNRLLYKYLLDTYEI